MKASRVTLLGLLIAGTLLQVGCWSEITGPTRQIESPEPPRGPLFTSVVANGQVAQAAYQEPAVEPEPFRLKPFAEWTPQEIAADTLGRIGPPAVPALIEALRSPDPEVRLKAVQVLARLGSDAKEAVPDLVRLLDDPDERIRNATTRTLGRIGPESAPAVPALMRTLLQGEPSPPGVELQPVPRE